MSVVSSVSTAVLPSVDDIVNMACVTALQSDPSLR